MTVRMKKIGSREEWLAARSHTIGGSDIAAVIGISNWKTNVDLWMEKTGRKEPKDVTNELTIYGTKAEEHIRELYALDFPEFDIEYVPNNLWKNDKLPYAHASLDFWIRDADGRFGVGEIKTAEIRNGRQKAEWDHNIPKHYLAQLVWNMTVTEADFGVLVAQLKFVGDDMYKITRHYITDMIKNRGNRDFLISEAEKFVYCMETGTQPALKLPEI